MENQNRQHFALIRIEGETVIPTEIGRVRLWEMDKQLQYDMFAIGKRIESIAANAKSHQGQAKAFKKFRNFKDDLRLTPSKLDVSLLRDRGGVDSETKKQIDQENETRKEAIKWSMKAIRGKRVRKPMVEFKSQTSTTNLLFNPLDAAQIFLGKLIQSVIMTIDEHFPINCPLKVHVTIPAYNSPSDAENYRNNLSSVLEEVEKRGLDIDFSTKGSGEFLYEPYGVFYYYAAVEGMVDFKRAGGHTYLIFDMGGSTTDIAVVQVNYSGNHSTVYPIGTSIECAGADFDEFLLESLLEKGAIELADNSDAWDLALREVESAKIRLIGNQEETQVLKLGDKYGELSFEELKSAVENWWENVENPIRKELQIFLQRAQGESKTNTLFLEYSGFEKVFLAGGSVSLPGLLPLLAKELEPFLQGRTWEDRFVQPRKAPATALASIGLAYEVSLRTKSKSAKKGGEALSNDKIGLMSRAEKIYGKFQTGNGEDLGIKHKFIVSDSPTELLLHEQGTARTAEDYALTQYTNSEIETDNIRNGFRFRLRTNFQSDWEGIDELNFLNIPLNRKISYPQNTSIVMGFSHDVVEQRLNQETGEIEVRFKPYFWRINGAGQPATRLDEHGKGTSKVVLTPPALIDQEDSIHVCIDFGMSNTCVAVFSPTLNFESGRDFEAISFVGSRSEKVQEAKEH
jgi:hypothetical protein